jgi:Isocitrate/isopropylmalate dehydrogenase
VHIEQQELREFGACTARTGRMEFHVAGPQTLDTNLHADTLSDLAPALAGSLGIAPTANINPERDAPSMFERIHGSAFGIRQGHRQSGRHLLYRRDDAGSGEAGCRAVDEGGGTRDGGSLAAHAGPWSIDAAY